jgi:NTE family protein
VPFPVICGTSAGAINAAMLAMHADDFRTGVARLTRLWRSIRAQDVYSAEFTTLPGLALAGVSNAFSNGRRNRARPVALLGTEPLARLLATHLDFGRLDAQIKRGALRALAINATSYASGQAVTFFQGALSLSPWRRMRRHGRPAQLAVEHLLASSAIPFIFPPAPIGDEYFMDGSVRQGAPLSPALRLGAKRIVVIAVGQFSGARTPDPSAPGRFPSLGQMTGHALSSIFLDNLGSDLERLTQTNRLVDLIPPEALTARGLDVEHVDAFVLTPSRDLGEMALAYRQHLPPGIRVLLRGFGDTQGTGANLTSYLLFDRHFCGALMTLGYTDAMARRDELAAFLGDAVVNFLPLPPRPFD